VNWFKKCPRHLISIATVASMVRTFMDLSTPEWVEKMLEGSPASVFTGFS
jgi:hypothetical protein